MNSCCQTHVEEQAKKENLNEAQAALLLAQTLEFNGLPQLQSPSKIGLPSQTESFLPPLPNFLEQFLSPGADFQTVDRLGEAAEVGASGMTRGVLIWAPCS